MNVYEVLERPASFLPCHLFHNVASTAFRELCRRRVRVSLSSWEFRGVKAHIGVKVDRLDGTGGQRCTFLYLFVNKYGM